MTNNKTTTKTKVVEKKATTPKKTTVKATVVKTPKPTIKSLQAEVVELNSMIDNKEALRLSYSESNTRLQNKLSDLETSLHSAEQQVKVLQERSLLEHFLYVISKPFK